MKKEINELRFTTIIPPMGGVNSPMSTEGNIVVSKKSYKQLLKDTRNGSVSELKDKFGRFTHVKRIKGKNMIEVETGRPIDSEHMTDFSKRVLGKTVISNIVRKCEEDGMSSSEQFEVVDEFIRSVVPQGYYQK